ncbi:hypothetical protein L596_007874 [Steinernema carpocapsae]|uniref:Uncharacterized protein n=1 Tax=Steinernema carpocapsae TaxID=34508 RepID=A0A4U5PAP7_STECR|nr:hypothetical protein L596_007874 [Steinernema carpocapsae]
MQFVDNGEYEDIGEALPESDWFDGPKLQSAELAHLLETGQLSQECLETLVVPKLLQILRKSDYDDDHYLDVAFEAQEQKRNEALQLLVKICRKPDGVSKEYVFEHIVGLLSHFLLDHNAQMRKHVFTALGLFSEMFGQRFTERYAIPHLIVGLQDREWITRRVCCENFVDVSRNANTNIRRSFLAPKFLKLLDDHSTWVARSASEKLGSFIYLFADENRVSPFEEDGPEKAQGNKPAAKHCRRESKRRGSRCSSGNSTCSTSSSCSSDGAEGDARQFALMPPGFRLPANPEVERYYQEFLGCAVPKAINDEDSDGSDEVQNRHSENNSLKVIRSTLELQKIPISTDLSTLKIDVNEDEDDYDYDDGQDDVNESEDTRQCESPIMGESANPSSPRNERRKSRDDAAFNPITFWVNRDAFGVNNDDLLSYDFGVSFTQNIPVSSTACDAAFNRETNPPNEDGDSSVDLDDSDDFDQSDEMDDALESRAGLGHADEAEIAEWDQSGEQNASDDSLPPFNDSDDSLDGSGDMNTTFVSFIYERGDAENDNSSSCLDRTADLLGTLHNDSYGSLSSNGQAEVSEDVRKKILMERIDQFRDLLNEKDVEFILNSHQTIIPQDLLDFYLLSVHKIGSYGEIFYDGALHFALNLISVAYTLGPENWPLLKGTFLYLCLDSRLEPIMASKLDELAAILGPEISQSDLVPVYNGMTKSNEEVKSILVSHLYDFLRHLPPASQASILVDISCFLGSQHERNWRFRYEFTSQCAKLCSLFELDLVNRYLGGIALTMCTDQVASVRDVALNLTLEIVARFVQEEWQEGIENQMVDMPLTSVLCEDLLRGFGNSQNWRRRQTFAMFCEKVLKTSAMTDEQFAFFFADVFKQLSVDRIANIRLKFCEALDRGRGSALKCDEDPETEKSWFMDERYRKEFLRLIENIRKESEAPSVRVAACRALGVCEDDELYPTGLNIREIELVQFEHLRESSGSSASTSGGSEDAP